VKRRGRAGEERKVEEMKKGRQGYHQEEKGILQKDSDFLQPVKNTSRMGQERGRGRGNQSIHLEEVTNMVPEVAHH
jgi:hypothetical protein